jgi:hypothetical protein
MPFSLRPDENATDAAGKYYLKDSNPYVGLGGHPDFIWYTPKENKYWISEGNEIDPKLFKEKFEQRLGWKFDRIEKDKDGKSFNSYPPTVENIAETRKLLAIRSAEEGNLLSKEEIMFLTQPTHLRPSAAFEAQLDKTGHDEKLARRLNSSSRY